MLQRPILFTAAVGRRSSLDILHLDITAVDLKCCGSRAGDGPVY